MPRKSRTSFEGRYIIRKLKQAERWSISVKMPPDENHADRWQAPRKKITAPDYAHALDAAKQYEHELLNPEETAAKEARRKRQETTLADFLETWAAYREQAYVLPQTLKREQVERRRIRAYLGDYPIYEIGIHEIMQAEATMKADGVSDHALYTTHRDLARILDYAVREGYINSNPCREMQRGEKPQRPKISKTKRDVRRITPEEIRELNASIQSANQLDGLHVAVWLALATGMRRGECLGLQWRDISLPAEQLGGTIRIRRSLNENGELSAPKTDASARDLPIGRTTRLFLERWAEQQRATIKAWKPTTPVCSNGKGGYFDVTNFERGARRFFARHGLGEFTEPEQKGYVGSSFHSLRRAYVTQLITDGVDPKTVQGLCGHEDIITTLNYYAEVLESSKIKIVIRYDAEHLALNDPDYPQNAREATIYETMLEELHAGE